MENSVIGMSQWETRVSDAFSTITLGRVTHAESLDILDRHIHAELNSRTTTRARYPAYVKGFVAGLISARRAAIWRDHVEFCYMVDGVLYTTSKADTGKPKTEEWRARGQGNILANSQCAHYWIGTVKQYSGTRIDRGQP